jgi:hypothetical protein
MEQNKAYLIEENGDIHEITPVNLTEGFQLKELYAMLECEIVEVIPLADGRIMICNEESKLIDEPVINSKATELYREGRPSAKEYRAKMKQQYGDAFIDLSMGDDELDDSICGHVVVCPPEMFK